MLIKIICDCFPVIFIISYFFTALTNRYKTFKCGKLDVIEHQLKFLLELQSGSGSDGDFLFADSEDSEFSLFICQICGSVQTRIPERACPICKNPAHFYKKVDKPA